jgi:hypothetical protein
MKRSNANRKGVALFFTLSTIMVISIIVFGMIFFMRGEVHLSENYVDGCCALMLAESGVEEALFRIKSQMNDPKNPIYDLITKKDEGTVDLDMAILEGKNPAVKPVMEGGKVRTRVTWQHDPDATKELRDLGLPADVARQGMLIIDSRGTYHQTKRQVQVKKTLKAVKIQSNIPGNSLGMIAPDHGLYLNEAHREAFKILSFDFWDPWGFKVKGGKIFMKDGAKIDLPKWLMLMTGMRNDLEHPWLDMGIGWTGWNGGADLTAADSIEWVNEPVNRNYNKWMGLFNWPWWERTENEPYNSVTKKVETQEPEKINLYSPEVYRRLANRLVDPEENPSHGKYFRDVNFQAGLGKDVEEYKNVIPLYGWGDWRNTPNQAKRWLGNPTRAHDTSRAVEVNGLTFIKGDVYLEGWVKGKGLLVVQGNIYVGGDVLTLPDDTGGQSAVGIIALRDPKYDHSKENPLTGRVIYQPHHDSDWSRMGVTHPFRNLAPRLESCIYAEGGLELKTDSSMQKTINMEIVGNLATDYFDRRRMPNDVKITYYNWQKVLAESSYDFTIEHKQSYSEKYELAVKKEIVSYREVDPSI